MFAVAASAQVVHLADAHDLIISTPNVTLQLDCPQCATVTITVNGQPRQATGSGGAWTLTNVMLMQGFNGIAVTRDASPPETFGLTVATIKSQKDPQTVCIRWEPGASDVLKEIATKTLANTPSQAEQTAFVTDVEQRTQVLVGDAFRSAHADVVVVPACVATSHVVRMTPIRQGDAFGYFPDVDCMNRTQNDQSEVFLGTFAHEMIEDMSNWLPMDMHDRLPDRTEDVAQALSRVAAHEIGHGLGLVGNSGDCSWMDGNPGHHPFEKFPPGVHRTSLLSAKFVMNESFDEYSRLGYSSQVRASRLAIQFCEFNIAYLSQLLP